MADFFNYTLITYSNRKQKLDWEKHKKFDIHPYAVLELNKSGKTKCARFEKRNVQKSGKTKRSKNFAHTTL